MFSFQSKIQLKDTVFSKSYTAQGSGWGSLCLVLAACFPGSLTGLLGVPHCILTFWWKTSTMLMAPVSESTGFLACLTGHNSEYPPPKKIIKDLKTTSSAFNWGWEQARNDNHQFCVSQEPQCRLPASTVARSKPDLPYKHTVLGARAAAAFSWAEMYFGKEGRFATKSHMNFALGLWRS